MLGIAFSDRQKIEVGFFVIFKALVSWKIQTNPNAKKRYPISSDSDNSMKGVRQVYLLRPRLHGIGSKWIRTQSVTDAFFKEKVTGQLYFLQ